MSSATRSVRLKIQPVVVHKPQRGKSVSWLYLLPAALLSLLFNAAFLGAFALLSSPNRQIDTERVNANIPSIKAEQAAPPPEENQNADPHFSPSVDIDPAATDVDADITFNNKIQAEVSIPGLEKPGEKVGIEGGKKDVDPFSIGAVQGLGGAGQGGAQVSAISGTIDSIGTVGGYGLQGAPLAGSFEGRSGASKEAALREGGGTTESEAAVNRGLHFLAKLQQSDGRWRLDAPSFSITEKDKTQRVVQIPDRGKADDVAATALGLLPFLAAGKTHKEGKDNPFDKPIEKALAYLMRRQDKKTGKFQGNDMYSHGLAAIAMCEAYGLTKDPLLKLPAQNALNFIVFAQHASGGWRYHSGDPKYSHPGDLSVVGWQIMALKSGQLAGLDVPQITIDKAISYLDRTCDLSSEGYSYMGGKAAPTTSAIGLLCRQYIQFWGPNNSRMVKGIEQNLLPVPPASLVSHDGRLAANGMRNIYYDYYATQVMHHFGGQSWKTWNEKMRDHLVATQVKDGDLAGSWDSRNDLWGGRAGGRLMQTSLSLLTLEVYYRHLPLFQQK